MNPQRKSEPSSSLLGKEALNSAETKHDLNSFLLSPRPMEQQEKELQIRWREEKKELQANQEKEGDKVERREDGTGQGKEEEQPQMVPPCLMEHFGEGLVQTAECSDTDRLSLLSI